MIVMSSLASVAAVALAASISFASNVTPIGTGAPSHVENRAIGQRSSIESTRGHASAVETRGNGAPSVASNLAGERNGDMRNLPVGGMLRHREGLPSMTDSREGEVSTFR